MDTPRQIPPSDTFFLSLLVFPIFQNFVTYLFISKTSEKTFVFLCIEKNPFLLLSHQELIILFQENGFSRSGVEKMKKIESCNGAILFGKTEIIKRFFQFDDEESKHFNRLQLSLELVIDKVGYLANSPLSLSQIKYFQEDDNMEEVEIDDVDKLEKVKKLLNKVSKV